MNLILSRHGNTFDAHVPVVWAGSSNDLPLVEKGIAQAEKFAEALAAHKIKPVAIYCSPLQRTRRYAEILIQKLALPFQPNVDPRINEIDYGQWTGLTQNQVIARFGERAVKEWEENSHWPPAGQWGGSEAHVIQETQAFVNDLSKAHKNDTVLVITSNGRLRYFLKEVSGEFEKRVSQHTFKMKTGNISKLIINETQRVLSYWNVEPTLDFKI